MSSAVTLKQAYLAAPWAPGGRAVWAHLHRDSALISICARQIRHAPRRLDALSAQTIDLARLAATAGPASSYVAPADRYAVVPGGPPSPGPHSGMAVPEMPEPKRQRAKS